MPDLQDIPVPEKDYSDFKTKEQQADLDLWAKHTAEADELHDWASSVVQQGQQQEQAARTQADATQAASLAAGKTYDALKPDPEVDAWVQKVTGQGGDDPVSRAFGDLGPDVVANMRNIRQLESGGNDAAAKVDDVEDSHGALQINARAHPDLAAKYDLHDPEQNAQAAREVYDRQGYGAWFNSSKALGLLDGGGVHGGQPAGADAAGGDGGTVPAGRPDAGRVEALDQFGQGLPDDQAYSVCGPVAALAFAQANGRNPTLDEARQLAAQVGWTTQGGMNGVANEQALLTKMGVQSRLDTNPDFGRIAQDAASGNPVIVSTGKHYYYVNGYDEQTGKLHVGKTGTARIGGAEWMSAQEIANLDGGINGALFVDNPNSPAPSVGANDDDAHDTGISISRPEQSFGGTPVEDQPSDTPAELGYGGTPLETPAQIGEPPKADDQNQSVDWPGSGSNTLLNVGPAGMLSPLSPPFQRPKAPPPDYQAAETTAETGAPIKGLEDITGTGARTAVDALSQPLDTSSAGAFLGSLAKIVLPVLGGLVDGGRVGQFIGSQGNTLPAAQGELFSPEGKAEAAVRRDVEMGGAGSVSPLFGGNALESSVGRSAGLGGSGLAGTTDPILRKTLDMYEAAKPAAPNLLERLNSARNWFVRNWTDPGVDLAQYQQKVAQSIGRPLNLDEMAYETNRLNPDPAAALNVRQNLVPAIKSVGDDRDALTAYLTYKSNVDQAAALGNQARNFSGISAAESAQGLQAIENELGPQRFQQVEQAASQVRSFVGDLLQRRVDSGLITQAFADDLRIKYPNYVPTKILDYMTDPASYQGSRTSLSLRDTGIRALTEEGTDRVREDPLASVYRLAFDTEARARQNETFNAFHNLAQADPSGVIRVVPNDYTAARGTGETTVQGFVNGQRTTLAVPPDLAAVVTQAKSPTIPFLSGALGVVRAVLASRNPAFIPVHAAITALPYLVRASTDEGGPQAIPRVLGALASSYADAFRGLRTGTYGPETSRYVTGGGGMQRVYDLGAQGAREGLGSMLKPAASLASVGDVKDLLGRLATFEPVEQVINRVDLAPRVAAMRLAEQRGQNAVQAVLAGRTATTDFQQAGTMARVVNSMVPFFNVATQASAAPVRAFRANPQAFAGTVLTAVALPTIAAEAWNRADDQRAQDYEDVPDYYKRSGIVLMAPPLDSTDQNGNRRPGFVHLPTREYSIFVNLARDAAATAMGAEPKGWSDLLGGAAAHVSPIPLDSGSTAEALTRFLPGGPIASTAVDLAFNKNPQTMQDIVTPQANLRASPVARAVADAVTTLRRVVVPDAEETPASGVDFALRNVGGIAGQIARSVGSTPTNDDLANAPVVGGVVGRFAKNAGGQRFADASQDVLTPENRKALQEADVLWRPNPTKALLPLGPNEDAPLSPQEHADYQERVNEYVNDAIGAVLDSPRFDAADGATKDQMMRDAARKAESRAQAEMRAEIGRGELRDRATGRREQATALRP